MGAHKQGTYRQVNTYFNAHTGRLKLREVDGEPTSMLVYNDREDIPDLKEIDWVVYLPSHGNDGRPYAKYGVAYLDRKKGRSQSGRRISLKEVLDKAAIKNKYPHTVSFFLNSSGKGSS
jgi:hypothetical protein